MNLNGKLGIIFESHGGKITEHKIVISRQDGTVVFTNKSSHDTEAVMSSSLWQSALELKKLSKLQGSEQNFQVDFHNSQNGIIMRSFMISGSEYYITMTYENVLNPGKLKKEFNDFHRELKIQMFSLNKMSVNQNNHNSQGSFLFDKLTDREIDDAFARIRD